MFKDDGGRIRPFKDNFGRIEPTPYIMQMCVFDLRFWVKM